MKDKHNKEFDIPPRWLDMMQIAGYSFFKNGTQFECATCLQVMGREIRTPMVKGKTRKFKLIKQCDCPPQK